ncbi:MAG: S8 family serine peptidase, partial [Egibacteraceae bacterium]
MHSTAVAPPRRSTALMAAMALAASLLVATPLWADAAADLGRDLAAAGEQARHLGGILPNVEAQGSGLVRLMAGAFDPLSDAAPTRPGIPVVGTATLDPAAPADGVVQFAGRDFAGAGAAIEGAGGVVDAYMADDAYLVRATPAQQEAIAGSEAVRASLLYQPAWKLPVAAGEFSDILAVEGPQTFRVFGYRSEPEAGRLGAALSALGGVEVVTDDGYAVDVSATAAELPAIAAETAVQWIEVRPTVVPLNANARWVNDTGVRDVYAAMRPGRLTGAGQTAGVADTGVNYTNDRNGNAHTYFRDGCDANGQNCALADYTQRTPGTQNAQLFDVQNNNTNHRKMAAYFDLGATGPNPSDDSAHGTHFAGSVTGDFGANRVWDREDGMAPGARLVHQNIGSPSGGLATPADSYQLFRQAYRPRDPSSVPAAYNAADYANYRPNEDARTHNNSYGLIVPIVSLGSAEAADRFVWEHEDMVIVSSAGNGGPGAGTMGAPSVGKNVVSSGASANGRQPMVSIDSMAIFSSHGPTGDGRLGVDLATPGQIVSSSKGGTEDEVHYLQGTSMSGPILTGLATLTRQYFYDGYGPGPGAAGATAGGFAAGSRSDARRHNPSAALVRATMVNGAERMRGWYTGDDGRARANDGQYPSSGQGFGLVNLENSLYFDDGQGRSTANAWFRDVYRADGDAFARTTAGVPQIRSYSIAVQPGQPLSVTMAFTDAPSANMAGTPIQVNNLDLIVTAPNGTTYVGNNFNTRALPSAEEYETLPAPLPTDAKNPVERVRIAEPAAGTWTITVRGTAVAIGPQGFGLAATGNIGQGFQPDAPLQTDQAGSPTIGDVVVRSVNADIAEVTWTTSEPTTSKVTTPINGTAVNFVDVYNLGDGTDGREPGYFGIVEGPVETSRQYANRPVVGTRHEVLVTGLSPGTSYPLTISATDLSGNTGTASASLRSTRAIYGSAPRDTGQLVQSATDLPVTFDPIVGEGTGFLTGTQLYAGRSGGSGILGAFMFRLPTSVDPSKIRGAAVELTSAHDITNHYRDDVRMFVDLLDESVEPTWNGQNYSTVHNAAADARLNGETGSRRGGDGERNVYSFAFGCNDLGALQSSLSTVTSGTRNAAFRFDAASSLATSLFAGEFGFNRRSQGADLRPRLVLYLEERTVSGRTAVQDPTPCDQSLPAPVIDDIGIQPGIVGAGSTGAENVPTNDPNSVTVSWRTNVRSDSTVLYRERGQTAFTQVSKPGRVTAHQVQVSGLDPAKDYEFAVRSTTCNGKTATDSNGGLAYDFFRPAPPPASPLEDPYFFHGEPGPADEVNKAAGTPSATFDRNPPVDNLPSQQKTSALGNQAFAENFLLAFWTGDYTGNLNGPIEFDWWWSTTGVPRRATVAVTVFADIDRGSGVSRVQPDRIVASGTMTIDVTAGPVPRRSVGRIDVTVNDGVAFPAGGTHELIVQVAGGNLTTENDLIVHYDSTDFPSQFAASVNAPPAPPTCGETLPAAGPVPPPSADATSFSAPATRHTPT